ncbi:LamG-like jellyroll fold domain-containing protein [Mesonia sp. K7]|uniref:LamG-like jellyroll fold domain-containing protein n=1 Tax=Mesonia sp. K7 TaxID=2218606 RepID=UPI000DA886F9|nr:LamG-like jellyroll fold domain-containing protein [Mesonia sp. K7]PZD78438.1 hypothetical protein DNG35_05085 [Mesonia sp. K7]
MTKKLFFTVLICFLAFHYTNAQAVGDTLEVRTWDYTQTHGTGIRDTLIDFPDLSGVKFEKILMLYNMRCKDGNVSPPIQGQTNIGCGEWDYSCNTYLEDPTRADSIPRVINKYFISEHTGATFDYKTTPVHDYYAQALKSVTLNSTTSETSSDVGNGILNIPEILPASKEVSKTQFLYTATELSTAGVTAGNIDAIQLEVTTNPENISFLKVQVKSTSQANLAASNPDLTGFTEVFYNHYNFTTGLNRIQFHTPYNWNGTDNIIVELSYTNASSLSDIQIKGENTTTLSSIKSSDDRHFYFHGENYIEADTYKGIGGNQPRSVEAWIKTDVSNKEICSWGIDQNGKKWVFRIDASGQLRVEVNGGYVIGSTVVSDGNWHHVAYTFQGNDLNGIKFYVDGQLETISSINNLGVDTDITNGIPVRISRGINNRYFNGIIDDVRVWSTELSQNNIQNWMHKRIETTHPAYSNLELNYLLNEGNGEVIQDASPNAYNAQVINGAVWRKPLGSQFFKDFKEDGHRPNVNFLQGTYNLTVNSAPDNLEIEQIPHVVIERSISSQAGTTNSDDIILATPVQYWDIVLGERYYDENSNLINTVPVTLDGTLTQSDLNYWERNPMSFELMSFVTPYGINLDLGPEGKTWTFDVTDFSPILKGQKRLMMSRGGQWQEDMDIRFLFIVGTPPQDVLDITQIWKTDQGTVHADNIISDEYFEPRTISLLANGHDFKVRSAITGHGQQGEFIPRSHYIDVNGGAKEFSWTAWKECASNPVYPQGGTWIYDRAGWCPGMATDVKESLITPYVTPGQNVILDYGFNSNPTGDSRYLVNHQLVTYAAPNHSLDARIIDIQRPTNKVEYARENPMCYTPQITLQNSGSSAITEVKINYWVNDAANKASYTWTGSLDFLEKEIIDLPVVSTLWSTIQSPQNNKFHAEIVSVNNSSDQYIHNNKYTSTFSITEVLPDEFKLQYKSNNAPHETTIKIKDSQGNVVYTKSTTSANSTSEDIVQLGNGCYTLEVIDTDGDGIDFWANNDGLGYVRIRDVNNNAMIKNFEGDFGNSIIFNFTVNYPLSYEQITPKNPFTIYPNPANDKFILEFENEIRLDESKVRLYNILGQEVSVNMQKTDYNQYSINSSSFAEGIYYIQVFADNKTISKKIMIKH